MIKPRTVLAASAALTILFSPNIFAEDFKRCLYTHEEYKIENGVKVYDYAGGVPLETYAIRIVGPYDDCPVLVPFNHNWTDYEEIESDNDITHLDKNTVGNENCEVHFKSFVYRTDFEIN